MAGEGMAWDWRGQPDLDQLDKTVANMTDMKLRVYEVNTGADEYGIWISDEQLTPIEAAARWHTWWRSDG